MYIYIALSSIVCCLNYGDNVNFEFELCRLIGLGTALAILSKKEDTAYLTIMSITPVLQQLELSPSVCIFKSR